MAIDYTSSAGRVRMLIGDTVEASPIMSADEITAALAINGSDVYGAAADCCRAIAASAAKSAIIWSALAGEISVDKTAIPKMYLALAKEYDAKVGQNDSADYSVAWPLLVSRIDGKDESDYYDTEHQNYYDNNNQDGE